jgi:monoamine oxidase
VSISDPSKDVVVVGAGLAGLEIARRLEASGRAVSVLEARDRIGGRVLSHTLNDGSIVELGAQWISPIQARVSALAAELGLETFPTYEEGTNLTVIDDVVRPWIAEDDYGLDDHDRKEVERLLAELDRLAQTISVDAPWESPGADEYDARTLDTWLRENARTETAFAFWRLLTRAVFAAEATQMSLLQYLFYAHSAGSMATLIASVDGAQDRRVVGGSGLLPLGLSKRLRGDVALSAPVTEILQSGEGVEVKHARGTVMCRRAVVALPPILAGRIRYTPPLPASRDQLTQQIPMGYVIKAMAVYDEPWWRAEGWSGFGISFDGPVSHVFDNSPPDARCGVLLAFVDGEAGRGVGQLPARRRREVVLDRLQRLFGARAASTREYVEHDWAADEWTRGCYGGRLGTGVWTALGRAIRQPVGRIHWAGAECAREWNGYMEGALRSAADAAEEVEAALANE